MNLGICVGRVVLQLVIFFGICYSFLNKCPRFSSPQRLQRSLSEAERKSFFARTTLSSSKSDIAKANENDIDPEDPYSEGFENQPEWLDLFPRKRGEPEMLREYPDFASLSPNDPLFLDMPWPTKAGPEATAFSEHMRWRRGLSDGERLRWQKWAVYERLMDKHHFKYSLDDYIVQNMVRDIKQKADVAAAKGFHIEESMWRATAKTFNEEQTAEITAVMKSFYSAFNRKNFDELRALWLPDEGVELTFPGLEKARGQNEVHKMYRQIIKESRPFGSVEANIVSVECNGFVAVVQSIETVGPGTELKTVKKKNTPVPKTRPSPPKRVFATTVLRKFNQQWRVMIHHAARFSTSPYTGDQKKVSTSVSNISGSVQPKRNSMSKLRDKILNDKESAGKAQGETRSAPPMTSSELQSLLKDGSLLSVSKMNKEGGWEKVVAVESDLNRKSNRAGGYGVSEDLDRINFAKQLQSTAVVEEESKNPRRIRLGNDGNLYLGDELVSNTVEKERASMQEQEESGMKLNSFASSGSLGSGGRGANSVSGIKVTKEGGVAGYIDKYASVSKQTIQALRYLFKAGRISRKVKETLLLDIINNVVNHETSLVVVAFELLVVNAKDSKEKPRPWSNALRKAGVGLEDFADQCSVLVEDIKSESEEMFGVGRKRSSSKSSGNNRKSLLSRSRSDEESEDE